MSLDSYRNLIALRAAAESIDEINVFMSQTLEMQVRLRQESAWDRWIVFVVGAIATLLGAVSIGGEWLKPGLILGFFLLLTGVHALLSWVRIKKSREELTADYKSVKDYLRKATRDRYANRVKVSIQNRRGAARLLEAQASELSEDDKAYLEQSVEYWGNRIRETKRMLDEQEQTGIWSAQQDILAQLRSWIAEEMDDT